MKRQLFFGILLTAAMMTTTLSAQAQESHFLVNQNSDKGRVSLGLGQAKEDRTQYDYKKSILDLSYTRSFENNWSLGGGTSFISSRISNNQNSSNDVSSTGIGDFKLRAKGGQVFDDYTWTYGSDLSLSWGASRLPGAYNTTGKTTANNFSGYHALTPFTGVESYYEDIALGARMFTILTTPHYVAYDGGAQYQAYGSTTQLGAEGFVEIPLHKSFDLGISMSMIDTKMGVAGIVGAANDSQSVHRLFGTYKFQKDTALQLSYTYENLYVPVNKTSEEMKLSFSRSL